MIDNSNYTPVEDQDEKIDIMEHINQDHQAEVLLIVQDYYPKQDISSAIIADIFIEGMLISAKTGKGQQNLFVKFELKGELEEQVLYLAYMAMSKQGKDLVGNKKHYFNIIDKQQLTQNMTRLTLQSEVALPTEYAGYAYGMVLKTLNQAPDDPVNVPESNKKQGVLKKVGNQALLWGLKKMSSERRQKVVKSMNKNIRLYTLRSAWQADGSDFFNQGYMDIFTHVSDEGISGGSQWTEVLNIGDIVFSRTESADKHTHLSTGKTLLIADETAYPALAGILDLWDNDIAPQIIIISQQQSEQDYFSEEYGNILPKNAVIHRIVKPVTYQTEAVLDIIQNITDIEGVWGALENNCAKKIRYHIRNERGLMGKSNQVKGYWRQ